jgi:hypothetical protein
MIIFESRLRKPGSKKTIRCGRLLGTVRISQGNDAPAIRKKLGGILTQSGVFSQPDHPCVIALGQPCRESVVMGHALGA